MVPPLTSSIFSGTRDFVINRESTRDLRSYVTPTSRAGPREQERSVQVCAWGTPFLIGLVLFLIMLAAYSVRPLLRWLGLL